MSKVFDALQKTQSDLDPALASFLQDPAEQPAVKGGVPAAPPAAPAAAAAPSAPAAAASVAPSEPAASPAPAPAAGPAMASPARRASPMRIPESAVSRLSDALRGITPQRTKPLTIAADGQSNGKPTSPMFRLGAPEQVRRIVCQPAPESHVLRNGQSHGREREKFRFLEHRLRHIRESKPLSRVLITSSVPKEGKTVVAINLAATLATAPGRVLIIDADLREPSVHKALGTDRLPGLADVLEGRAELSDVIVYIEALKLYYLPAGDPSASPLELLQSSTARTLMGGLKDFDWVIVDSPPLLPFADAHCLATLTDGVLLVTRAEMTRKAELERAVAALKDVHVAGVVLNCHEERRDDYYYSYYRDRTHK